MTEYADLPDAFNAPVGNNAIQLAVTAAVNAAQTAYALWGLLDANDREEWLDEVSLSDRPFAEAARNLPLVLGLAADAHRVEEEHARQRRAGWPS